MAFENDPKPLNVTGVRVMGQKWGGGQNYVFDPPPLPTLFLQN